MLFQVLDWVILVFQLLVIDNMVGAMLSFYLLVMLCLGSVVFVALMGLFIRVLTWINIIVKGTGRVPMLIIPIFQMVIHGDAINKK